MSWDRYIDLDDDSEYADVFRAQLRMLHRCRGTDDEGFGFLNRRAFSETDLLIQNTEDGSELDSVVDRYGLIDVDDDSGLRGTVCVPDGVIIEEYECKLEPEFFENLAEQTVVGSPTQNGSVKSARRKRESFSPTNHVRLKTRPSDSAQEERATSTRSPSPCPSEVSILNSNLDLTHLFSAKLEKNHVQDRDNGSALISKKVTMALGSLRKSLGIGKWKKGSMDEDEWEEYRQKCTHGRRSDRMSQDSAATTTSARSSGERAWNHTKCSGYSEVAGRDQRSAGKARSARSEARLGERCCSVVHVRVVVYCDVRSSVVVH